MMINSITEAKAQLSALVDRVAKGETIIIGRAGRAIARLVPYVDVPSARTPGALRGKIRIARDFDELPVDTATGVSDQRVSGRSRPTSTVRTPRS